MESLREIAGHLMRDALSYRTLLRDVRDGRCSADYGPYGNIERVSYQDGRTFSPDNQESHTSDLMLGIIDHSRKMAASTDPAERQISEKVLKIAFQSD